MSTPDPDIWKEIAGWMGAALAAPVAYVWKKVNNSVQKDEFREFCARFDQHCRDDREIQHKLFDKIDDLKTTIIERLDR